MFAHYFEFHLTSGFTFLQVGFHIKMNLAENNDGWEGLKTHQR